MHKKFDEDNSTESSFDCHMEKAPLNFFPSSGVFQIFIQ